MKIKKLAPVVLAAMLLASVAAGCGNTDSETSDKAADKEKHIIPAHRTSKSTEAEKDGSQDKGTLAPCPVADIACKKVSDKCSKHGHAHGKAFGERACLQTEVIDEIHACS